ncbi:MAG: class I SAM-dependent methyltransferase [Actinomycetota bacterium]|nr:class I SAM-dependent methyltransferase [Actinomycetota bacterium]
MLLAAPITDPGTANRRVWAQGRYLRAYATQELRPVEAAIMARHRERLSGRVLEAGVGAGRIAGHLIKLADELYGIDLSWRMIEECRRRYPEATFLEGDISDLSHFPDGTLDALWAGCNLLDIFDDAERRSTLREIHRVLAPGGLLVMSSHNRAYLSRIPGPLYVRTSSMLRFLLDVLRVPRSLWRRWRLGRLEQEHPDYAIVNDDAHGYALVHYYTMVPAQVRQLGQEGFRTLECLDLTGRPLAAGETAPECVELHYVAVAL